MRVAVVALLALALLALARVETDEGQWKMGTLDSGDPFWWRPQPGDPDDPEVTFDEPPGQWKLGKACAQPPRNRRMRARQYANPLHTARRARRRQHLPLAHRC